jgi:hypothetical protein
MAISDTCRHWNKSQRPGLLPVRINR